MYTLKYSDKYCDPFAPDSKIFNGQNTYEDNISNKLEEVISTFDKYIYLVDLIRIVSDCFYDLINVTVKSDLEFYNVNKYLLNYVNAVYSHKLYIIEYANLLNKIINKHYESYKWYWFICCYRNIIIHQSTFVSDYSKNDVYIDMNKLIYTQENIIKTKKMKKNTKNDERFLEQLKELEENPSIRKENTSFYSLKEIIKQAQTEIEKINSEVLTCAFETLVKPKLDEITLLIYSINNDYKYTFIVNDEAGCYYQPNHMFEYFICHIFKSLDSKYPIYNNIIDYVQEKKYNFFYTTSIPTPLNIP